MRALGNPARRAADNLLREALTLVKVGCTSMVPTPGAWKNACKGWARWWWGGGNARPTTIEASLAFRIRHEGRPHQSAVMEHAAATQPPTAACGWKA